MLNEAIETLDKGDLSIINIPLSDTNQIILHMVFAQTSKKRYLQSESIQFADIKVTEPFKLASIKAYLKRFAQGKLTNIHKNKFLEPVEKTIGVDGAKIKTTSLYVIDSEPKVYISDIDAEAILEVWRDALLGYNKVKIYETFQVLTVSEIFSEVYTTDSNGTKIKEVYAYDSRHKDIKQDITKMINKGGYIETEVKAKLEKESDIKPK